MTIKEIAEAAGVSLGTVDRVLHNRGRVSDATRDKVMQIIKASGYRKNIFASNLAGPARDWRIGIFMPHPEQDGGYWAQVRNGLETAERELHDFNFKLEYFFFDRYLPSSFIECYNNLRKTKLSGVIAAPVMTEPALQCFIERPLTVPQIFFDSDVNAKSRVCFVGHDSLRGGRTAGKLMSLLLNKAQQVAVIAPDFEGGQINDRIDGFRQAMHEYQPDTTITVLPDNGPDVLAAKLDKVAGIFVCNASAHRYATLNNLKIIGYDVTEVNQQELLAGNIEFLISQNPELQGYHSLNLFFRHLVLHESIEQRFILPIDIITRENYQYSHIQLNRLENVK